MTLFQLRPGNLNAWYQNVYQHNNENLKERGFIMKAKTFIQLFGGVILILMFLTACGGGGIETNFSTNTDGIINIQNDELEFFADATFTRELQLTNHLRIRLEAFRGDIDIEGRDDVGSIIVTAQKWVWSDSLKDAKLHLNDLEILVTDQIDEVLIQTVQPKDRQGRKYIVDYHIILPSNLETEVTLTNGDISILNIQNSLLVDDVNGNVSLSNIVGNAVVDLVNGSINGTVVLPLNGEIRLSTDNGNIDLSIPTSTSAKFAASVTVGSIKSSNLEFDAAVKTAQSLTGTLDIGEGVIDLYSNNGSIRVVGFD